MVRLIKLREINGEYIYINPEHIVCFNERQCDGEKFCSIRVIGYPMDFNVMTTAEEIIKEIAVYNALGNISLN